MARPWQTICCSISGPELAQLQTSCVTREPNAMHKLDILVVAIAAILVAASVANAVFLPIPQGPIRACPFGAIWAVIWNVASGRQAYRGAPFTIPTALR